MYPSVVQLLATTDLFCFICLFICLFVYICVICLYVCMFVCIFCCCCRGRVLLRSSKFCTFEGSLTVVTRYRHKLYEGTSLCLANPCSSISHLLQFCQLNTNGSSSTVFFSSKILLFPRFAPVSLVRVSTIAPHAIITSF